MAVRALVELGATAGWVWSVGPEPGRWFLLWSVGEEKSLDSTPPDWVQAAARARRTVVAPWGEEVATPAGTRAAVPLVAGETLIGVIAYVSRRPPTEELRGALGTLAVLVANALQRVQSEPPLQRLILESAGEGIFGLDTEGRVTFVNPAALLMTGYDEKELIGRRLHEVVHHSRPDRTPYPWEECPAYAALRDGAVHRVFGEVYWRRDGTSFPVEYVTTPIRKGSEIVGTVTVFRDVTERQKAESELALLQTVAAAISRAGDIDTALSVALEKVCTAAGWAMGQAWVPYGDAGRYRCSPAWYGSPQLDSFRAANQEVTFGPGEGLVGQVVSSRRALWVPDLGQSWSDPRAVHAASAGLRSALAVPVVIGSGLVAVLEFFHWEAKPEEIHFY